MTGRVIAMAGVRLIMLLTLVTGLRGEEEEDFFTCLPGIKPYIGGNAGGGGSAKKLAGMRGLVVPLST